MKILAIETSCDETAVSLVESTGTLDSLKLNVLGDALYSQVAVHAEYGGVFPSLAKREHQRNLVPLLKKVLGREEGSKKKEVKSEIQNTKYKILNTILAREPELLHQLHTHMLNIRRPTLDAVAVTYGPGLEPALWTGINFARALSTLWEIPLIPINHMEGHIFSALLKAEKNSKFKIQNSKFSDTGDYKLKFMSFPSIALLISGGHTELVLIKNWFEYEIIGQTRDDAVGEAFDKVARMLELPYPGGPEISKLAETARSKKPATSDKQLATRLPRPMLHDNSFDFSFSGLKTAVLYMLKNDIAKSDFTNFKSALACEFQDSVAEVLVAKTMRALQHLGARTLIIGGGVSANAHIGREFEKAIARLAPGTALHVPEVPLTGDNALMIAAAAAARAAQFGLGQYSVNPDILAQGNLRL